MKLNSTSLIKTFSLLFFTILLVNKNYAATVTTATSGNWSNATTWNITVSRPGTITSTLGSRIVTGSSLADFTSTLSIGSQLLNTSNVVIGTVESIQSATSLTLVANAAIAVTNAGWNSRGVGPGDAVSISIGHTITVDDNYTCLSVNYVTPLTANSGMNISANKTLNVTGTYTMPAPGGNYKITLNINNGLLVTNNLSCAGSSSVRRTEINIVDGSLDINNQFTSTTITGSYINVNGNGSVYFSGALSTSFTFSLGTGSNVIYDRNAAQTLKNTTYYNLTIAGTITKAMSNCIVSNKLQIEGNPVLTGAFTYSAGASLVYNTSTNRTATSIEWPSNFTATQGVIIKNTGTITLNENKTIAEGSLLQIDQGATLATNNFQLTLNGNFVNNGNFNAGSSKILISGSQSTQSIGIISTTGEIECAKTSGTATFTGNISATSLLTSNSNSVLKLGTNSYNHVFNQIVLTNGVIYGGNSNITLSMNIRSEFGSFIPESSTITLTGSNVALQWGNFNNLILNGGTFNFPALAINGNFIIKGGSVFTASASVQVTGNFEVIETGRFYLADYDLTINGSVYVGDNLGGLSYLQISGSSGSKVFSQNINIYSGAVFTILNNGEISIGGNLINEGEFIPGNGTITFNGLNKSINSTSSLTFINLNINGIITNNAEINIANTLSGIGQLINSNKIYFTEIVNHTISSLDASTNANFIYYSGNGDQSIINTNYYHLSISGSGNKTILANTNNILGNLELGGNISITLNYNISIAGNLTINGNTNLSTSTNVDFYLGGDFYNIGLGQINISLATIHLNSVDEQSIQNESGEITISNLIISGGNKIFNSDIIINSSLELNGNSGLKVGYSTLLTLNCVVSGTGKIIGSECTIDNLSKIKFARQDGNIGTINIDETLNYFYEVSISNNCTVTIDNIGIYNSLNLLSGTLIISENIDISSTISIPINKTSGFLEMLTTSSMSFGIGQTGSSTFTLPNSLFASTPTFKNFTLNRTADLSLGNNDIVLTGTLTISLGNLITNGKLRLKSDANGTARVATIINSSNTVIGNVTVERYIPGGLGKRKWRLMSFATNNSSTMSINQLYDDIFITAPAGSAAGFDVNPYNPANTASLRTYSESTSGAASNGWTDPSSINSTIATGQGYEVFVRGSRNLPDPYLNWTIPDDVTIDYTGNLNSNDITKTLSYTNTANSAADGFNLVGNPYASTIDFENINITKNKIENKFWSYNPNTGQYGVYDATLHTGTNSITQYIASSQAFFVKANAANPSITFRELAKTDNEGNNYFKSKTTYQSIYPMIKIGISNDSTYSDETIVVLDENASALANDEHDANKWFSDALNIYTLSSDNINLNIDARKTPSHIDSIKLAVFSYNGTDVMTTSHTIDVNGLNSLPIQIDAVLWDKFLNTYTNLKVNSRYEFMITSDKNSYGKDRFVILLGDVNIGIHDNYNNSVIKVFPNPSNGELNLTYSEDWLNKEINYSIIDQSGRTLKSTNIFINNLNTKIDISELLDGFYVLEIISEHKTNRIKFIKRQ